MGSLEDRFREEDNRQTKADIDAHNNKVDKIRQLLPRVIQYLHHNPGKTSRGWVSYNDQPRIALQVGWYRYGADNSAYLYLIPTEQVIFTTSWLRGSASNPDAMGQIVELRHVETERDRIMESSHIDALYKGFNEILPKPKPARSKRWGRKS